jgi:hypothetical protein
MMSYGCGSGSPDPLAYCENASLSSRSTYQQSGHVSRRPPDAECVQVRLWL